MKRKILILFGIGLLIQSCQDEEATPNKLSSFPMTVGTEWIYENENIIKKYESETSNKIIDIDTIRLAFRVLISKDTVLRDSIAVKEFVANEIGSQIFSKQYYKLDKDGLKEFAYKSAGAIVFAKKKSTEFGEKKMFKTLGFDPVTGIDNLDDILHFYDIPRLSIKLPLSFNDKWTYSYPSGPMMMQIDKEVIGYERVKTSIGIFECYKIKHKYINSSVYEGIEWIDWISEKGLIKRQSTNERVTLITAEGESLGNCQLTETLTIKGLKIK